MHLIALTPLGLFHTVISLIALAAAIYLFIRYREILSRTAVGKIYIATTVVACLTALGIFQNGGFGVPHALALITLVTLGIAAAAGRGLFGSLSRYVEVVGYTATVLFHLIPAFVETATRLPAGNPWVKDREGPLVQGVTGGLFLLFLIGAALQVWRLRRQRTA